VLSTIAVKEFHSPACAQLNPSKPTQSTSGYRIEIAEGEFASVLTLGVHTHWTLSAPSSRNSRTTRLQTARKR